MATILQGGTVLVHQSDDSVQAIVTDILVTDSVITKIEPGICPRHGDQVIDCRDKIISPGFVDTHHHVWQTQLKGRHANQTLLEFFPSGDLQAASYTPSDVFWGQLGGCLEALDAGTTTVVDHAHVDYSPEHSRQALSATVSSGIRSIFCYAPTQRVLSWSPFALESDPLTPTVLLTLKELASSSPHGSGRVDIGLGFDSYHLPKHQVQCLFKSAKAAGVKLITSHYVRNAQYTFQSVPQLLHSYGLLDSSVLLSHCTGASEEDVKLICEKGANVASTPSTEIQMAMAPGVSVCLDERLRHTGIGKRCSLGVDCHSNNANSLPAEMRLVLQVARGRRNEQLIAEDKAPRHLDVAVQDVFNLGTIQGARAIGMEDRIGSIAVGKKADLVVFSGNSPAMICASRYDPVAAVVMHSSPKDVELVLVDGRVCKHGGELVDVYMERNGRNMSWSDISKELDKSYTEVKARVDAVDLGHAVTGVMRTFGIDAQRLV